MKAINKYFKLSSNVSISSAVSSQALESFTTFLLKISIAVVTPYSTSNESYKPPLNAFSSSASATILILYLFLLYSITAATFLFGALP